MVAARRLAALSRVRSPDRHLGGTRQRRSRLAATAAHSLSRAHADVRPYGMARLSGGKDRVAASSVRQARADFTVRPRTDQRTENRDRHYRQPGTGQRDEWTRARAGQRPPDAEDRP